MLTYIELVHEGNSFTHVSETQCQLLTVDEASSMKKAELGKKVNMKKSGKITSNFKSHGMKTRNDRVLDSQVSSEEARRNIDVSLSKGRWNLEVEIAKVIEKGVALGFINGSIAQKNSEVGINDEKRKKSVSWSFSEEVANVIKARVALGFYFNGDEDVILEEIMRRELKDDVRFQDHQSGSLLTKGIEVEANGSVGGLLTLWNEKFFEVNECISNERCIIVDGLLTKVKKEVIFCNVYVLNEEKGRVELWQYILKAQTTLLGPWVIGGDFNTVLDQSERNGGLGSFRPMKNFEVFMDSANTVDIPMHGMSFTWSNNREIESWARLDKFLCNPLFLSLFLVVLQRGLGKSLSDHNPMMLGELEEDWGPRPFRNLNGWMEDKQMMAGKVICAKYGLRQNSLMWEYLEPKRCSPFVKTVIRLFDEGFRSCNIINKGFHAVVGKGDSVRLCGDLRWDSIPLKNSLPRIFALATNKDGVLKGFGRWED
ncbi:hypothetical protein Dsin_022892 [Dipteronia sinensis]|uniref:Uncharacterized protein n=1 Tax=Dipteronia sinensis TaxID=43782 RepID=A0AAE0A3B7_9ROSI|nr:hypothetical protein Dsin_022892 [Dipteronia sinensis]